MECVQQKDRNVGNLAPLDGPPQLPREDRIHLDGDDPLHPAREGKGAAAEASPYLDY